MALSCYDEALRYRRRSAEDRRSHPEIIAEEIGVTDTIDPIAGSYYVEALTSELERLATQEMQRIEEMAAPSRRSSPAITTGDPRRGLQVEQAVNEGERVVVGVNKYRDDDEPEPEYFKVDQTMASSSGQSSRSALRTRLCNRREGAGYAAAGGGG